MRPADVMCRNRPTPAGRARQRSARALRAVVFASVLASAIVADVHAQLRTRVHASGFSVPIAFVQDPDDRAVQFVVQQDGRIRVVRDGGVVLPTPFIDLSAAMVAGGEQGLLGLAFPPDSAASGRFFVNFTNRSGDTVVARLRRSADAFIADPVVAFRSALGRRRDGLHRAAVREPQRRPPRVRSGRLSLHRARRRRIGQRSRAPRAESVDAARQDAADRRQRSRHAPVGISGAAGQPVRAQRSAWRAARRSGLRPAQPVALFIRRSGRAAGPARSSSATSGRTRSKRVDYEPANRGGRNYGWRNREGAHDNVHVAAAGVTAARRSDPRVRRTASASRSPAASSTAAARCRRRSAAATSSPISSPAASGRSRSRSTATAKRGPSDVIEHTAELSNAGALGNISSFGVDADGELYHGRLQLGPHPQDHRPGRRAARADRPAHHSLVRGDCDRRAHRDRE